MSSAKSLFMRAAKFGFAVLEKLGIDLRKALYNRVAGRALQSVRSREPLCEDGVSLVAEFAVVASMQQVARDFLFAISKTAIPFDAANLVLPVSTSPKISDAEFRAISSLCGPTAKFRRQILFTTIEHPKDPLYETFITPFWEFESGLLEARPHVFDGAKHVIAFSDFLYDYYRRIVPNGIQVDKIRYPYSLSTSAKPDRAVVRQRFPIPESAFVVFFNFSFASGYERKNPESVLEAFSTAGLADQPSAMLVFKVSGQNSCPGLASRLASRATALGIRRLVFIDEYLPRQEILDLTSASDVYVSLHRGEGLGIGMLEAMSVGVPVIATNYGGNTDFCKNDTAFLVDYRMSPAHFENMPDYVAVKEWAEPNVETAAKYLRLLFDHPQEGARKSKNATMFISEFYNTATFEADVRGCFHSSATCVQ